MSKERDEKYELCEQDDPCMSYWLSEDNAVRRLQQMLDLFVTELINLRHILELRACSVAQVFCLTTLMVVHIRGRREWTKWTKSS